MLIMMVTTCSIMLTLSKNLWFFEVVFSFGSSWNCMGLSLANMVDGPISFLVFDHNLFRQLSYHISWHKIRASGQNSGLLWKKSHIILPVFSSNNADSFFNIMQETPREQCPCDRNKLLSLLGLVMCVPFLVLVMLMHALAISLC